VILIDANLLLYAIHADLPLHSRARGWLEDCLNGQRSVGLPWSVLLAVLRLSTNPRLFPHPLSIEAATEVIDGWLARSVVHVPEAGPAHWPILRLLLLESGTGGNLCSDAHLAALAIEHGYVLHSADNDFRRFRGLKTVNPLEPGL
jgi:toxin-antitoxin system PIN domain toxin